MRNCQEHLFPLFIKASMFQAYLADEGYTMNNKRQQNLQKNQMEIIEKIKKPRSFA
jgi:hypothetical protein